MILRQATQPTFDLEMNEQQRVGIEMMVEVNRVFRLDAERKSDRLV